MNTEDVRVAVNLITHSIHTARELADQMPCRFKEDIQKMAIDMGTADLFLRNFLEQYPPEPKSAEELLAIEVMNDTGIDMETVSEILNAAEKYTGPFEG